MTGTCNGNITINTPCVNTPIYGAWSICGSDGFKKRTVTNSCTGSGAQEISPCTYTPQYKEAVLTGCSTTPSTLTPGETFGLTITISPGTLTETYKITLTGDLSASTSVSLTPQSNETTVYFTVPTTASGGTKNYTVTLTKV